MSSSCQGTRASYGIKLCRSGTELGTGKVWFDSMLIAQCGEAIRTSFSADSMKPCRLLNCDTLAFDYFWCQDCDVGLHLVHKQSMMYTFQFIYSEMVDTLFLVDNADNISNPADAGGGAIYTQAVAIESNGSTLLDVKHGGVNNAHYDIGGVRIGASVSSMHLLKNATPSGSAGTHFFRFRDSHFRGAPKIDVDRTNGGQSIVELAGCRGVQQLQGNVKLTGNSSSKARLIVRDCEIPTGTNPVKSLIDATSVNHEFDGVGNWDFSTGFVGDEPNH